MPEFEQVSTTSTTTTQPTSVIVQQQPLAMQPSTQAAALQVNDVAFGPAPVVVECPYCHYVGPTEVKRQVGPLLAALVCALFFIIVFFSCILLCIPAFKRPTHYCSHCGKKLGNGKECSG